MLVDFEYTCAFMSVSLQQITQRTFDFFLREGYTLEDQTDGLHFQGGKRGIRKYTENYWRHVNVYFSVSPDGVKARVQYSIAYPLSVVMQLDRMYWDLELQALRATLSGESMPDWKPSFNAYRDKYNREILSANQLSMVVFLALFSSPLGIGFWLLGQRLNPFHDSFWLPAGLLAFFVTSTFVWMVLSPFFLEIVLPPRKDAEQIWREALGGTWSQTAIAREFYHIDTPENVVIAYEIAGLAPRSVAAGIDYLIIAGVGGLGWLIRMLLPIERAGSLQPFSVWFVAIALLVIFVIQWGYFVFFELYWNGQSPGKRWLSLRVIHTDGTPVKLVGAIIRNLIRIADYLPGNYFVGVIATLFSDHAQRLGDLAADTVVIREK